MTDETSEDAPRSALQSQSTENTSTRALLRILEDARVVPPESMATPTTSAPSGDIEAPGAVSPTDDQAVADPTGDGDAEAPQPDTNLIEPKEEVPPTDPIPVDDDNTDADPVDDDNTDADPAGDDNTDADPAGDDNTDADPIDDYNTDTLQPDANPVLPKEEVPPTDPSSEKTILLRPGLEIKDDKQNESKPAWKRNRLFYRLCLGCLVVVGIVVTVTTSLFVSGRNSQQDGSAGSPHPKVLQRQSRHPTQCRRNQHRSCCFSISISTRAKRPGPSLTRVVRRWQLDPLAHTSEDKILRQNQSG